MGGTSTYSNVWVPFPSISRPHLGRVEFGVLLALAGALERHLVKRGADDEERRVRGAGRRH